MENESSAWKWRGEFSIVQVLDLTLMQLGVLDLTLLQLGVTLLQLGGPMPVMHNLEVGTIHNLLGCNKPALKFRKKRVPFNDPFDQC
jgi:hypothetical protein